MSETPVLDLTFIKDERRRIEVAEQMALVYDEQANGGVHWRWDHLCKVTPDLEWDEASGEWRNNGEVRHRVASYLSRGHRIVSDDPLTIEGSLACRSCGLHGFVRNDRWESA